MYDNGTISEKTAVYSQENARSGIPLFREGTNECMRDVANDCARAHHRHSAIQSLLSDGEAPNCMESVMASDTSLYFEGLYG